MSGQDLSTGEINALLGRGTEYEGKLICRGRVRIDGKFTGEIFSEDVLILGESAEVHATSLEVGTLIVRGGTLHGNVIATQLIEVYAPSRIYGNLTAPQVYLDKGAFFEGQCTMGKPAGEPRE
jgi:cytoskeletal protein CcmA (bactofilin family)